MPSARFDSSLMKKLDGITKKWKYEDFMDLANKAPKKGLKTTINGEKVLDLAKLLIGMAEKSLKRAKIKDVYGRDESWYLEPIKEFIFVKEMCPAEWLVKKWQGEWGHSFFPVFEWCRY